MLYILQMKPSDLSAGSGSFNGCLPEMKLFLKYFSNFIFNE